MRDVCLFGDCRESMRKMIAEGVKVQTCVTSPPYWGLRDYGTARWNGGEAECEHVGSIERLAPPGTEKQASNRGTVLVRSGNCACGAIRVDSQLGLEPTPEEYVANMVEVFRLVRDLLADDGTLWLNLGDSYASNSATGTAGSSNKSTLTTGSKLGAWAPGNVIQTVQKSGLPDGLKPKDLVGIPWRVAFALQADGWYLRSDIIWHKPNPMPESVTDRPTKAHEYLFLLSKRERYFYDADAIKEPSTGQQGAAAMFYRASGCREARLAGKIGSLASHELSAVDRDDNGSRNRRTVWTVATEPYSEAHFATFPTALIEPCILAGTSQKGHCPGCGKGWVRVVERAERTTDIYTGSRKPESISAIGDHTVGMGQKYQNWLNENPKQTTGWQPSCACNLDPVPGIVFDPFLGSGTTAQVAQDLGRHWLGCELNGQYSDLQKRRAAQMGLAFG